MKKLIGVYDYTVVFTYLGLALSLLGIVHALRGWFPSALLLLGGALICDTIDGKVARTKEGRTETEKQFGIQIDSLCDMISFGVFPALLCIGYGLSTWLDYCLLAFYCLCCVIRLGYYNVLEQNKPQDAPTVYHGLPMVGLSVFLPSAHLIGQWVSKDVFLWILRGMLAVFGYLYILDFRVNKPKLWLLMLIGAVFFAPLAVILWMR